MRKKYGKFYADWHDEHGQRKMKAFPTRKQALHHSAKMHRLATTKKPAPRQRRIASVYTLRAGKKLEL
jgi:hypothetical protein